MLSLRHLIRKNFIGLTIVAVSIYWSNYDTAQTRNPSYQSPWKDPWQKWLIEWPTGQLINISFMKQYWWNISLGPPKRYNWLVSYVLGTIQERPPIQSLNILTCLKDLWQMDFIQLPPSPVCKLAHYGLHVFSLGWSIPLQTNHFFGSCENSTRKDYTHLGHTLRTT